MLANVTLATGGSTVPGQSADSSLEKGEHDVNFEEDAITTKLSIA